MLRFLTALALLVTIPVWGVTEARLLGESRSGQTVLFNSGIHDGLQEGDYAIILKQIRSLEKRDLRVIPVAKARNIKVNSQSSLWIMYKIYDSELLIPGDKFLLFTQTNALKGRKTLDMTRTSIVARPGLESSSVQSNLKNHEGKIAKKKDQYPEVIPLHQRSTLDDKDGELLDVEQWKKAGGSEYRTALYKSPSANEFQNRLRLETFEKLVTAYVRRVNEPEFNYDQFYDEQMKSPFGNEFRKRSNFATEYETFLKEQARRDTKDARLYRSILEKGETWSEDFSDEELKLTLTQVSGLQEKDRRVFVMAEPKKWMIGLMYGQALTDAQTEKDAAFRRDDLHSLDLDLEVIPVLKHAALERFTISGLFRNNETATESSDRNVEINESSFGLGANWYPWYAPYAYESPVVFLGTYFRSGFASMNAPSAGGEKGKYTMFSVPGFKIGLRYIMKSNIGVRILASMETLQFEKYSTGTTTSILPETTSLVDTKLGFGMTYSF